MRGRHSRSEKEKVHESDHVLFGEGCPTPSGTVPFPNEGMSSSQLMVS